MELLTSPRRADPRRRFLAVVLALIAAVLIAGGIQLAALGGSIYYAVAGVVVALCAYWSFRGDVRGRWLYAALLGGTLLWALWERGPNIWAIQARALAPAVLGIWVFWPALRRWPRTMV